MNLISIVAWGVVLFLLQKGISEILDYISAKRSLQVTYEKMTQIAQDRLLQEEMLMRQEGNREKVGFLTSLDILLSHSGIKRKFPFLTAEMYLCFAGSIGIIALAIVWKITDAFIFAVIGSAGVAVGTYMAMHFMTNANSKNIEEDMTVFLDLVSTYSKTSDDIVDILGKVYPSMNAPLNKYLEEFYFEAINVDAETAFLHLKYKLPHDKMREVIGNLEMCSKRLTDYSKISSDAQEQFSVYLKGKKERANVRMNGSKEVLIFYGIAVVIFWFVGNFAEVNMVNFLLNTTFGQCVLLYFSLIGLVCLLLTFKVDKG